MRDQGQDLGRRQPLGHDQAMDHRLAGAQQVEHALGRDRGRKGIFAWPQFAVEPGYPEGRSKGRAMGDDALIGQLPADGVGLGAVVDDDGLGRDERPRRGKPIRTPPQGATGRRHQQDAEGGNEPKNSPHRGGLA